ncbi:MAG: cell division protein SepF [Actinomycetota bacterium]
MSFLRSLRAYIGLGPDDEIEDRYLSELNARRRQLALDEIHPDHHEFENDDEPDGRRSQGPRTTGDIDLDLLDDDLLDDDGDDEGFDDEFDLDDDGQDDHDDPIEGRRTGGYLDGLHDADDVVVVGPGPRSRRRSSTDGARVEPLAGFDGFDPNDELDLAFIERMGGLPGARPGRHDIEPSDALEALIDEGGQPVTVRARLGESGADDGAVVHSLDSMRAKPRTLMPESFADAKLVADEFKRDVPVVLNLQTVERDLARRLIDFASGICYVLDGSMEKIASQVFLLIPDSVEVSDDDRRRIEERGYAR